MVNYNQSGTALLIVVLVTTLLTWLCIRVSYGSHAAKDLTALRFEYEQQMQFTQAIQSYGVAFCAAESVELDRMADKSCVELLIGPCIMSGKKYQGLLTITKQRDEYQLHAKLILYNKSVVELSSALNLEMGERGKVNPVVTKWKILNT